MSESKVTLIKNLPLEVSLDIKSVEITKTLLDTDQESLSNYIMDFSLELKTRINSLELFYKQFGQEETLELVNRLATLFQFSGTKVLEKYIYEICVNSNISTLLKITAAKSLCYFDVKKEIGYVALDNICKNMSDVPTPVQIDAVCLLMKHKKYKKQSRDYFCSIINNDKIDCDYRYKAILSLENKDILTPIYFLKESAQEFFNHKSNRTLYRILAGQLLIQKCKITVKESKNVETTILGFSQDVNLDYNLRADAADVILRLGSLENKVIARDIIMILGRQNGHVKTIFDNAQNVHIDEIEESVLDALEFLSSIEMKTISNIPGSLPINFAYVKKHIDEIIEKEKPDGYDDYIQKENAKERNKKAGKKNEEEDEEIEEKVKEKFDLYTDKLDKINISLNRIYMDRAMYSKYNCNLLHILLKVWTYLSTHESDEEMKTRLIEELVDMSGTCSSGFASRLVNVISGFGEFNFHISFRDQLIANFTGRLNARARDITKNTTEKAKFYKIKEEDLDDFQDKVLMEMSVTSQDYASRTNFLRFFRRNMLPIREELYEEFRTHITDTDFDLFFRQSIATYETGGYV